MSVSTPKAKLPKSRTAAPAPPAAPQPPSVAPMSPPAPLGQGTATSPPPPPPEYREEPERTYEYEAPEREQDSAVIMAGASRPGQVPPSVVGTSQDPARKKTE